MSIDNIAGMYVKSYFAASVKEAMDQARGELGPDALLLNTREAPPEARHLGACEVVFGSRPQGAGAKSAAPVDANAVDDLRQRMQELSEMMTRMERSSQRGPAATNILEEELCKAGLTPALARDIDAAVWIRLRGKSVVPIGRSAALPAGSPDDILREAVNEIEDRFAVTPELNRITALVGPCGSGKTTALVKLAVARGLLVNRPVRIISMDHYRIGAAEQLATYAAILGVPFSLAVNAASLEHAIDAAPEDALILIDTPGYTAASYGDYGKEVAEFFEGRQDIDTHLVLTASMNQASLDRAVTLFQPFRPAKLLFTRLDETDSTGSILCTAARAACPLSFFSTGPSVPEDIEPATKARISGSVVRELPNVLRAVA